MSNKYCNLIPTNKIKAEYIKINNGFAEVESDIDATNTRMEYIIAGGGEDKDPEIVDARLSAEYGSFTLLKDRLDNEESERLSTEETLQDNIDDLAGAGRTTETVKGAHDLISNIYMSVKDYGAIGDGVTDNTTAFQNAINDCFEKGGGIVYVPSGKFLINGYITILPNVTLSGTITGPFYPAVYDNLDVPTILITNTYAPLLVIDGANINVKNLMFFYPNQVANDAIEPIEYPFITVSGSNYALIYGINGFCMDSCTIINAYNALDLMHNSGKMEVKNCYIGAYHTGIRLDHDGGGCLLDNIAFAPGWHDFSDHAYPTAIDDWVHTNNWTIDVRNVDGLFASNIGIFSAGIGIYLHDSPDLGYGGYGQFSNVHIEAAHVGVMCASNRSAFIGWHFSNLYVGSDGTGLYAVATTSGGASTPNITVTTGNFFGAWTAPVAHSDGLLDISNVKNYNPQGGLSSPAIPASTVEFINPFACKCQVNIKGGTVTDIQISNASGVYSSTGLTSGSFILAPGQEIKLTYTVAPTWTWFGI